MTQRGRGLDAESKCHSRQNTCGFKTLDANDSQLVCTSLNMYIFKLQQLLLLFQH